MGKRVAAIVLVGLLALSAHAGDWPMYRADAARSGYTAEPLPAPLALQWTYRHRHAPAPAWPKSDRLDFDRAYHAVIANGTLYFGSSADHRVYALDATTGRQRWSFLTDGPVRFAPAVWKDRVFVAGDDGFLYCLSAATGEPVWKKRSGPDARMVLGNGRMVSRWCVRGGPAVADGVLYYAAGIWPTDGVFIHALDAASGAVLWCNEEAGSLELDQPHPTARARSGVAAQGYLVVDADHVFVPTGRAVPAAFDRRTGKFEYFHLQKYGHWGGAAAVVLGPWLFNSDSVFNVRDGLAVVRPVATSAVAGPPGDAGQIVYSTGDAVHGLDRSKVAPDVSGDQQGKKAGVPGPSPRWTIDAPGCGEAALVQAGDMVVCASSNRVTLIDITARALAWSAEVEGEAEGLAVADGRLYVSTDRGVIHCFGAGGSDTTEVLQAESDAEPYGEDARFQTAAAEIVAKTGVTEGFCLDLGCGDGRLAYELARRTNLQIYAVDSDVQKVAAARAKLGAASLYGVRVVVHQAEPAATAYPNCFADLIVSGRGVADGAWTVPADEVLRLQRPYGGVAYVGRPGAMKLTVRGELEGAGEWTHQYCDAANTCCSADTLVRGPLEMLWFDRPDRRTPNRHGRSPAPMFAGGRLFVEGLDEIRALNAYNGRELWVFPVSGVGRPYHQEHLMGVAGTHGNFCVAGDTVYVGTGDRCIRIEAATGRPLGELAAPPRSDGKPSTWGYIACVEGILFGSLANTDHIVPYRFLNADMGEQFTESMSLFALDAATGGHQWTYTAAQSIRHNAIAIGTGRVHLIDRSLATELERDRKPSTQPDPHPTGRLVTLDAKTGAVLWSELEDIYGTLLALSERHDVLVMCYQATHFRLSSELGGRVCAFRASDGTRLWDRQVDYRSRPVINDRTIYLEPGALDLLTGETVGPRSAGAGTDEPWQFTRSYGCGIISGSCNLLLFRSATLGYVDLLRDAGTENFGGIRPGCWINALPVGGLVLLPDTTNVCTCSYLNKATVALQPKQGS